MNVILNLILMWPMKLGGLALATSISASFNFIALYILLRKKLGDFGAKDMLDSFLRVVAASLIMAVVLKVSLTALDHSGLTGLCVTITAGIISFLLASYIFGVKEMRDLLVWILKRR
jgi:putative peptidoglycan lipid II flippase